MTLHSLGLDARLVDLEGATNFRDVGGYRTITGRTVRPGLVYRSDSLQDLTTDDVQRLLDLRLGEVLDLRSMREVEMFGATPLTDHGVERHQVGFFREPLPAPDPAAPGAQSIPPSDDHGAVAEHYLELLEHAKPALRRAFTEIAEAERHAVVFHCTAGRDRTGLTAALLLSTLEVDVETIAADYQLTERYLRFPEHRLAQMRALFGDRIALVQGTPPTPAGVMRLTLTGLAERYGTPIEYLREAGVDGNIIAALRSRLLADA